MDYLEEDLFPEFQPDEMNAPGPEDEPDDLFAGGTLHSTARDADVLRDFVDGDAIAGMSPTDLVDRFRNYPPEVRAMVGKTVMQKRKAAGGAAAPAQENSYVQAADGALVRVSDLPRDENDQVTGMDPVEWLPLRPSLNGLSPEAFTVHLGVLIPWAEEEFKQSGHPRAYPGCWVQHHDVVADMLGLLKFENEVDRNQPDKIVGARVELDRTGRYLMDYRGARLRVLQEVRERLAGCIPPGDEEGGDSVEDHAVFPELGGTIAGSAIRRLFPHHRPDRLGREPLDPGNPLLTQALMEGYGYLTVEDDEDDYGEPVAAPAALAREETLPPVPPPPPPVSGTRIGSDGPLGFTLPTPVRTDVRWHWDEPDYSLPLGDEDGDHLRMPN